MPFIVLPTDIIILVLQSVSARELAALSRTCKLLHSLVTDFGWAAYLRANVRPSFSLSGARKNWSSVSQVRYDFLVDCSWSRCEFVARPLSRPWATKTQPILAISATRLVIAAGTAIISYKFGISRNTESPPVYSEGTFSFARRPSRCNDITGITFVEDGGMDVTLRVGLQDGTLHHVLLITPLQNDPTTSLQAVFSSSTQLHQADFVESLSSEQNFLLSLSSRGIASFADLDFSTPIETLEMKARSWVSHLCLDSSSPYAAFGTSSTTPLRIHSVTQAEISTKPYAFLHSNVHSDVFLGKRTSSAVYGISRAPASSPWGASPQILISGWFDGKVRCHNLRSSVRVATEASSSTGPAPLSPVLTMRDPFQLEPIYSVACGGGSSSHIAAGSARHSVVCFWDIRSSNTGWGVHAPGNDRSPVYSVVLESSRLYGATQSRPFVYDFGSGVGFYTYPSLPGRQGIDGLKWRKGPTPSVTMSQYILTRIVPSL